jgi:hypothetical protein
MHLLSSSLYELEVSIKWSVLFENFSISMNHIIISRQVRILTQVGSFLFTGTVF